MRYLHITLFSLAIVALVSGQDNYTCVGNPYFTSPYMPNPVTLIVPDKAALDVLNITYNPTTQIYNLSSYNNLTLCEGLKTVGSCCTPDVLTRNAQSFKDLLNLASNETLSIFDKRADALKTFGKNQGKLTSNVINLFSRLHRDSFKILLSAKSLLSNQTMLDKISDVINKTNLNTELNNLINSTSISQFQIFALKREILSSVYQVLNAISDFVGIKKADIAELFAGIKLLFSNSTDPSKVEDLWNPFPRVNSTLYSDTLNVLQNIFGNLLQRSVIIRMNIATPEVAANTKILANSGNLTLDVPYLLDSRNLESIAKAILTGIGNATNDTEAFKNVLKNKDSIYKSINDTLITNMTNLTDFQTGGDLVNVKTLFITLGKFTFDDALKKVVSVAKNKKKCLKYVFQYQGFVGCLACDPSAVALGKIKLNRDVNTFDTIISEAFGNKMFKKGKCTAYYRDALFMDLFIWRARILEKLYENHQKAQIDVTQVDADPLNATLPSNKSIDLATLPDCPLNQSRCDDIRSLFIDSVGPKVSFLCDYNLEDCSNLDAIRATRNPFMNKNNTSRLQDYDNSFGNVSFVSGITNDVSKEQVGFKTKPNFTVPINLIANITVDTAQESDKETGSITGNVSGLAASSNSQFVGAFGLKLTVGAWLILAAIISTLL